uniref:Uncharacterized protein n=1 Tax=Meloidogyne javanica TaxID=6303 RepID=A0A915LDX5_MELJA
MLKYLIIIYLIIQTHSWTWDDYPPPRGPDYWRCGVTKPAWVCDPDGMLTDEERAEIVKMVEDFKEKTKRPNSIYSCLRDGLRLVVALAKNKVGPEDGSDGTTVFDINAWYWTKDIKYPSPRGPNYWKCRVSKPTYVCDPDGMLTDQQRKEIVELVEDFKEKTKNPNSMFPCAREGLRLIVALATDNIAIGDPYTVCS